MKDTGGSAFPLTTDYREGGMTLRDYFAAKAMQAILSAETVQEGLAKNKSTLEKLSAYTYKIADKMLEARK
jgi:hypothetical protein